MTRLLPLAALLLAGPAFASDIADPPAAPRPNVLLVLLDDLGYSDLGCYGGEIATPRIDALAANGVRFESFYNSARCCPSRASLMTGLYPPHAGIASFTTDRPALKKGPAYLGRLNEQCVTLAEALKPAGYGCYYVGKWHLHPETGPIRRGFDEFYGYTRGYAQDQWTPSKYARLPEGRTPELNYLDGDFYATDAFSDYALEFLKQAEEKPDEPWFLMLSHSSPHFPVQAPAATADKYQAIYERGWDALRAERFDRMRSLGLVDGDRWELSERAIVPVEPPAIANNYPGVQNPAWESLPGDRRRDLARRMAIFAAMVEHVDRGVGRLTDRLKATGQFENTLILVLSDNGACYEWGPFGFDGPSRKGLNTLHTGEELREMGGPGTHHSYGSGWANLGNTPLRLYKHFCHEGGVCTPMIAHWPAGLNVPEGGRWERQRGHVMDVLPTLLELAGAEYPAELDGREIRPADGVSLWPALYGAKDGGDALPDRPLFFEHQAARAAIRGDWKAVWGKRMPEPPRWELYNLAEDRCETRDLAAERPALLAELAVLWEDYAKEAQVEPFTPPPPRRTEATR